MTLILLPDLGALHRLHPQFNAGTAAELLRAMNIRELLWATADDPDHPLRDALPAAGISLQRLELPDWAWADTEHDQLRGFLNQYPQGRDRLRNAAQAEQVFAQALTTPRTPADLPELLTAARAYQDTTRAALDEGPGTRWHARRLDALAELLRGQQGAVLLPLDDLPGVHDRLPDAQLPDLSAFTPGELSRVRALADRAWQLREDDDLSALLTALDRETGNAVTPRAELDAAAASIYLATGQLDAARTLLERAAHTLADGQPRSLAGLVLARLGQVRDAQGDRDLALRTYRAVLALSYAPQVALDTAQAGLKEAFQLRLI